MDNTEGILTIVATTPSGTTEEFPASSCSEILQLVPQSPSGLYFIRLTNGTVIRVFCEMELICPEETAPTGWMRVASFDVDDTSQTCPSEFINQVRRCRRGSDSSSGGCSSTTFSVQGVEYSSVCGMAIGYHDGTPNAFLPSQSNDSIDGVYFDGISLTYDDPRQHIWTFTIGLHSRAGSVLPAQCPCTNPQRTGQTLPPDFVGNDYFCETGREFSDSIILVSGNPMWDGEGCTAPSTCCEFNNPPWFRKEISPSTSEDIEMRLCSDEDVSNEDPNFQKFELYIQ